MRARRQTIGEAREADRRQRRQRDLDDDREARGNAEAVEPWDDPQQQGVRSGNAKRVIPRHRLGAEREDEAGGEHDRVDGDDGNAELARAAEDRFTLHASHPRVSCSAQAAWLDPVSEAAHA